MRRVYTWADRKYETYYLRPAFRSFVFVLLTVAFLVTFALGVVIFVKFHRLLTGHMPLMFAFIVLFIPVVWLNAYRQHRRIRRYIEEADIKDQRLLKEVASSSSYFVTVTYIIIGLSLTIISYLLKGMSE